VIDPLCVAALNTPATRASAQVFLTVLRDALLGPGHGKWRASTLLLPRHDLGRLLPDAAVAWLTGHGTDLRLGQRVTGIHRSPSGWQVDTADQRWLADEVVLACPASEAARLVSALPGAAPGWADCALRLNHEPIATVYLRGPLERPWPTRQGMVALRNGPAAPAQYAFHRNHLQGHSARNEKTGDVLLALVASACALERGTLEAAVLQQAQQQLGMSAPQVVLTVVEKRATFACTPGLQRPGAHIAAGLHAAGDYVDSPYPATLESAVRSGLHAAAALHIPTGDKP
jgi:hydroxysqualene dehydroxylase